jgi:hypothetical protein
MFFAGKNKTLEVPEVLEVLEAKGVMPVSMSAIVIGLGSAPSAGSGDAVALAAQSGGEKPLARKLIKIVVEINIIFFIFNL